MYQENSAEGRCAAALQAVPIETLRQAWQRKGGWSPVRKQSFLSTLYTNTISLPRQARNKHAGNPSKNHVVFMQVVAPPVFPNQISPIEGVRMGLAGPVSVPAPDNITV